MRKALVVGIDYYKNIGNLYGCVNDANNVRKALERNSDKSVNFEVFSLLGANENKSVERGVLRTKIKELFSDDMEIALFYFAGHGYVDELGGYLVTSECKNGEEGISLNDLMTIVNKSKTRNKIIILDSCYSGIIAKDNDWESFSKIGEGVTILTACSENQYAEEEKGSGVFTSLLVDALCGGASNLLGYVTPGSIYAHIDQAFGSWGQRPVFKTNVKEFVSLRRNEASIDLENLQMIDKLFEKQDTVLKLDTTYEPTSEEPNEENCKKFAILQKLNRVNLVVPVGAEHMYYAAMEGKGCKLTNLGMYFWDLARKGRI